MGALARLARRVYTIIIGRPVNLTYMLGGRLLGSAKPYTKRSIKWLAERRVKAVLSLTEHPLSEELLRELGQNHIYMHIPVKDHDAPSLDKLNEAVRFIEENLKKGIKVLVHCDAGKGRTGVILSAFLIKKYGLDAEEAITRVRSLRPGAVENAVQVKRLREYHMMIRGSAE